MSLALAIVGLSFPTHAQDYGSSVVGTEYDFILDDDPSTFLCLESKGPGLREMPDKTGASPLVQEAFRFVSYFEDGTSVDLALDQDFETEDAARAEAMRYVQRLGKLPTALRAGVQRMVIHRGSEDTTAFSDAGLIALYSGNASQRIATHDLEETLFHESVHAAWDAQHADSPGWRAAQAADGAFVTRYAQDNPDGEDLAESALFAYTLLHHPDRIPAAAAARIRSAIPARIEFVAGLIPPDEPVFREVGPRYACDGSGATFTVGSDRLQPSVRAVGEGDAAEPPSACSVNITTAVGLSDILSNALMRGLDQEESRVSSFLAGVEGRYASANALLAATTVEFGFDRGTLDAEIQEFLHCNCSHGDLTAAPGSADAEEPAPAHAEEAAPAETRTLLYGILVLLLLLLIVNTATLVVLLRRSGTGPREPRRAQ